MKNLSETSLFKRSRRTQLWFLIFAGLLAVSLPTSLWFMSVAQFLLAGVFVAQGLEQDEYLDFFKRNKLWIVIAGFVPFHLYITFKSFFRQLARLRLDSPLVIFLLFYLVHVAGLLYSDNPQSAMASLRIKLPALLLPLFFFTIKGIKPLEKNRILLFFVLSTFVGTLISTFWFITDRYDDIREISLFIHHIHFSLMIAWSIILLIYTRHHRLWKIPHEKTVSLTLILWFGFFLLFILKSLTGIGVLIIALYYVLYRSRSFGLKISGYFQNIMLVLFPLLIAGMLGYSFIRFYDLEKIDPSTLNDLTPYGNTYKHYPERTMLENGNYVFFFIAEEELREVWNNRSDLDFDGYDNRGQILKYTVIRYLTSLGSRKDGHSLNQLTNEEIQHIEQGLANYLYAKDFSLYQRIYQIIWEIDRYIHTADPSDHSFTQRIESVRIGLQIAGQNPWFGYGTGDTKEKYLEIYRQRETQKEEHQRIVGANQFLNFVVAFGIVGFVLIMFALLYPPLKRRTFKNPLFNAFLVISVVAMFGEEMLKFQAGMTFFTFFYCYFVFLKEEKNAG